MGRKNAFGWRNLSSKGTRTQIIGPITANFHGDYFSFEVIRAFTGTFLRYRKAKKRVKTALQALEHPKISSKKLQTLDYILKKSTLCDKNLSKYLKKLLVIFFVPSWYYFFLHFFM